MEIYEFPKVCMRGWRSGQSKTRDRKQVKLFTGGRGCLQAKKKNWLSRNCQCDVTFRLDEIQNGAQWVKCKRVIKMRNFAPIFCPDCLGSLICGLYYIEEFLFGTFCKPKYSAGR